MNSKLPTGFKILHVYLCMLSHVQLFAAPGTVAFQDPVHGIFQARILEWGAIYYSRGSFPPKCSMTYPSSPLQSYPLLSAPTHTTHTHSFSVPIQVAPTSGTLPCLFPYLEHPAWDLSLLFFTQVKTQMSIPQWRPCSLQLPIILLYFPHRTYCYPLPTPQMILLVCLLIVCLSCLSISSNLAWIHP